jgi:NADH:ubiquinone oxidoreductase subunit 6 (subunit J)
MVYTILILLAIFFAIMAVRARRLIASALWLAGVSALVAVVFFLFGAQQVAVVELSVGAGLVTVLFVFAISIAGEEPGVLKSLIPTWLGSALILLMMGLLGWFALPSGTVSGVSNEAPFITVFWHERGLDMLVQVSLIFAGVLGLIGLLAEAKAPLEHSVAEQLTAERDIELERMGRPEGELEKEVV